MSTYELRCRECGKAWGNQPRSICEDCFSPLEVAYDYDSIRPHVSRELFASRAPNLWRYRELLPLPAGCQPSLPTGYTPLLSAPQLGQRIGSHNLYLKNDAVCLPTLSFKDRVVAVALANARHFGFDTVACSSTGNLANSVAAQAAREGFKAWIFIPSDLEPAKILGTQVFGAQLVRINGNYDQVNRLCSQIADERRWGFVNVNLRPYYAEGSKTVGFEIAEQLGWRLPDNIVVPMAGGSLITKIRKAFEELILLGLVEPKPVKFFGAQATGCSPISTAVKYSSEIEPQKPATIARSLAIGNPADGHYAVKAITASGGWSEDVSDGEVVASIQLLAESEGIFTETAGGVTVGTARKLIRQDRILAEETTVLCITGNGLKTTDVLAGKYETETPIAPKLREFEALLESKLSGVAHLAGGAPALPVSTETPALPLEA
ncbi:MAG: threonine synthase [Acidobacteriales bacterium]|nr:threonine synthase [Candidatus Koribacter versatilis]MBI3646139.1 threonine synthase [Terriglobales bacterium]